METRVRQTLRFLFNALLLLALLMPAGASAASLDTRLSAQRPVALAAHFEVLEDPLGTLTLSDIQQPEQARRFRPSGATNDALNYGVTASAYWLRVTLDNPTSAPVERLLEIAYTRLQSIELFQLIDGQTLQHVRTGFSQPFASRPYPHRFFVFPLVLPAQTQSTVYLRIASVASVEVPATLWTPQQFQANERVDYMLQAAYLGMVAAMLLFNLLLLMSLRERGYLLYILYVLANTAVVLSSTGLGAEYLWGDLPGWTLISFAASTHLTGFFILAFMRHMLGTARRLPRMDKLLIAFMAAHAIGFVLQLYSYQLRLVLLMALVTAALMIGVALYLSLLRQRSAYLFLAAFTVLLSAVIIFPLRISGWLPTNFWTVNGIQIGSALELIVLAFALADRFHVLRAEKERAQQEALNAERKAVEVLRHSERILEARVEERTAELSATVDRLQQIQSELVEAEKFASLGSLVAGVAHELNTPIGNALTTATALEANTRDFIQLSATQPLRRSAFEGYLNNSLEMGQLVVRSLHRSAALISSFKQVAVDQSSEQRRSFDLGELIENNISTLRPSFKTAKWTLLLEPMPPIPCESYPGPLGQIILNIVQNAHVHAFEGRDSGCLRISASSEGDEAEIRFSDDGVGMSRDTLAHVFDPFFTTKLGKGGSGLGMAISKNLATHLGGQLNVTSREGLGTCFTLRIPRVRQAMNLSPAD